jgi:hypothetical protein
MTYNSAMHSRPNPIWKVAVVALVAGIGGVLSACTGTANVMNLGTWIRNPDAIGACVNPDGSGAVAVTIQRGRVYQFGADLYRLVTAPEGTAVITFSAEGLSNYRRPPLAESWTTVDGKPVLTIFDSITVSTAPAAVWRLRLPDETAPSACTPSSPGYHAEGIPLEFEGRTWYLRPQFYVRGEEREVTQWWHWPALVLLPVGLAVDVVTFPIQAYYMINSLINVV